MYFFTSIKCVSATPFWASETPSQSQTSQSGQIGGGGRAKVWWDFSLGGLCLSRVSPRNLLWSHAFCLFVQNVYIYMYNITNCTLSLHTLFYEFLFCIWGCCGKYAQLFQYLTVLVYWMAVYPAAPRRVHLCQFSPQKLFFSSGSTVPKRTACMPKVSNYVLPFSLDSRSILGTRSLELKFTNLCYRPLGILYTFYVFGSSSITVACAHGRLGSKHKDLIRCRSYHIVNSSGQMLPHHTAPRVV